MTKPVLTAFLEESQYAKAINQEYPEDYLEELCRCSMWSIPLEEYFQFIKDNPDVKGNAKAIAEWRIKKLGLDLKNEKGEKSELEPKGKEEDLVTILQADNEYLASECMEQEELIDKLAADLKAAGEEKEKLIKESEQYQTTIELLKEDKKKLEEKMEDLQLSLNENLIGQSVLEKKKYHDVPDCRSDVEFATFLFERERRLNKDQRGFVFECFNRKVPHRIIWQNVSA